MVDDLLLFRFGIVVFFLPLALLFRVDDALILSRGGAMDAVVLDVCDFFFLLLLLLLLLLVVVLLPDLCFSFSTFILDLFTFFSPSLILRIVVESIPNEDSSL